jgi:hypothetical protein
MAIAFDCAIKLPGIETCDLRTYVRKKYWIMEEMVTLFRKTLGLFRADDCFYNRKATEG